MKCLLVLLWKQRIRENIHSPRCGRPRGIFVTIARDFQIISKLKDTRFYVGGFLYLNFIEVYKITFRNSIVQSTVELHNINTQEDEEVTCIGHKSGKTSQWRQFCLIVEDTKSKIK